MRTILALTVVAVIMVYRGAPFRVIVSVKECNTMGCTLTHPTYSDSPALFKTDAIPNFKEENAKKYVDGLLNVMCNKEHVTSSENEWLDMKSSYIYYLPAPIDKYYKYDRANDKIETFTPTFNEFIFEFINNSQTLWSQFFKSEVPDILSNSQFPIVETSNLDNYKTPKEHSFFLNDNGVESQDIAIGYVGKLSVAAPYNYYIGNLVIALVKQGLII